jgi:hypothetical protein
MVRTRDYVDEGGPKYRFYSFFLSAKYLVTWYRVVFATVISFLVATVAYGVVKGAVLIFVVVVVAFFSGRYAGEFIIQFQLLVSFLSILSQQHLNPSCRLSFGRSDG